MQELSEINQKVRRAEVQDKIYIKSLQKKLHKVNEKRNECEREVDDMNKTTSKIFHQLQSSLHKVLVRDKTVDESQIKHRKILIKTFIKSYLKVREKESLLAKQLSNRLQQRMETEETFEAIEHVKESLQESLILLREMNFNVSESLLYLQRPQTHNFSFQKSINEKGENKNQQVVPYRNQRLLSFQPSTKYHALATTKCLEKSINNLTTILSYLSVAQEKLQRQLNILQSGQYPKNDDTSSQDSNRSATDNTEELIKAEQVAQKAAQYITDVEDTLSNELKELSEKEEPGHLFASSTMPFHEEDLSQAEKLFLSLQDEIMEELETELDFENAKLVAIKRSTHQDKQIIKALEQEFSGMQLYAEKEFKFHLQSLENIQEKTSLILGNMEKNGAKISMLEEEYSMRKQEEKRLKQDLDEIKRKAKRRAPCVPIDLSHTVL